MIKLIDTINYTDTIQLDGFFSVAHINYGDSPLFNGSSGKNMALNSRKHSVSSNESIDNVIECIMDFSGIEKDLEEADREEVWRAYWLEYVHSFFAFAELLPNSVVTAFIGRQSIELGLKYVLLMNGKAIPRTHDLGELANIFKCECNKSEDYLDDIEICLEKYSKYIEGGNPEYFRYPEYKHNVYFAGNSLDIEWLSYNFAIIICKLIHFANLDYELDKMK